MVTSYCTVKITSPHLDIIPTHHAEHQHQCFGFSTMTVNYLSLIYP